MDGVLFSGLAFLFLIVALSIAGFSLFVGWRLDQKAKIEWIMPENPTEGDDNAPEA
jgi:hypothetical protein